MGQQAGTRERAARCAAIRGVVGMALLALMLAAPAGARVDAAPAPAAAPVDLAKHLKRDDFLSVKISPTGAYYAVRMNLPDREALAIMRRSDRKIVAKVQGVKHSEIGGYWWVNDERVMVAMAERFFGARDEPYLTGELHAINADNTAFKTLVSNEKEEREGAVSINLVGTDWVRGDLVATLPDDPRNALVAISPMNADPLSRVEKLDLYTGRGTPVARAPLGRADFVVDPAGRVRFALGLTPDNASRLYHRDGAGGDWTLVNDHFESGRIEQPLGFSADGRTAYLRVSQPKGPDAVVAYDPASGARRELVRDPVVDPGELIHGFDGRSVAGLRFEGPTPRTVFFDEQSEEARLQRLLEKVFPGLAVEVTSRTRDGRLLVILVSGDRNPGDYYLFDRETKRADGIFSRYGWLDPEQLAPTRPVALKARDGLPLHGFLTTPKGREGPLPMVLLPHGGPFGIHDAAIYDPEVQMLAEAGYAVLRVNYRGSGNHGRAFMLAGARQWGRAMQDDLTDATRWAVEQKLALPDRVCIVGASYGGYAAMMGLAREPALYRCGVGYVGVYDLPLMLRKDARAARWMRDWSEDWVGKKDEVAAVSPVGLAAAIRAPVLLAAGGRDERAPIDHSKRLERAIRAAGGSVQTLYYPTEGHGFYTEANRLEYYRTLLAFLAAHLGGTPAAGGATTGAAP